MTASSAAGSSGSSVTQQGAGERGARKSMTTRPKDWLEETRKGLGRSGEPGASAGGEPGADS